MKAINNIDSGVGLFCNLEKSFNYFNPGILVHKVDFKGISSKFLTLIQSYLTDRYKKCTHVSNLYIWFSGWKKDINGVPLGLILCSLLLIYINDLPKITDNDAKVVLFADDTSITVTTCNRDEVQTV